MKIYWIDLFCGAGGTSTGIHFSNTNSVVLACVNHDANAIKSHLENHPDAHHFTEDIRDFQVVLKLKKIVDKIRETDAEAIINIWASLECTNFSKAKGGQSRDADSRTLAEHMFMYLEQLNPDYFYVENVREFMCWGPLCENGKPISRTEGKDYIKWIEKVKSFGFKYDAKILNSANYGAYQSRERLFIQFAKNDYPIDWPEQTHTKDKIESPLFPMKKWKAVREILDLKDEGESIFTRKKPLSENTLKRIYAGLLKFVAKGDDAFTKRYNGGKIKPEQKVNTLDKPMGTICTNGTHALVKTKNFILNPSWGGNNSSIENPSVTIVARQDKAPLYIVSTKEGELQIPIYDTDSETMILIKEFMIMFGIFDIKMRMLKIDELKQIQGFPKDYKLIGSQTEQKKFIGNAVEVNQAKALVKANYNSLLKKLSA